MQETIAAKIINFVHLPSTSNIADVLTKPLSNEVFHGLMKEYLFRRPKTVQDTKKVAGFTRRSN